MDTSTSTPLPPPQPTTTANHRIKFNVGGELFETTASTTQSGGVSSLLSTLSSTHHEDPIFIDRDPEIFSALLSLLRNNHLPSTVLRRFSPHQLLHESVYYGLQSRLIPALSPPPLSPFDAAVVSTLSPPSAAVVSAFSADDSSLSVAHGGQISLYDSTLTRSSTVRTHLDDISSVCRIWPENAAVGSDSTPGLHFYGTSGGRHVGSVYWSDPTDPRTHKSRVTAIENESSNESLFASFECRHGENAVLVVDKSTLKVVSEIGRQTGTAAKSAAIKKLTWTPAAGLLIGSSISCGAFGYSGYVRAWDLRSGEVVWETSEPGGLGRVSRFGDTMADVDVDREGLFLAKVCSKSGDLGVADMRKLGPDPWVYLEDPNPSMSSPGISGQSMVVHCYQKHVFVAREGELGVWSRVEEDGELEEIGGERNWGMYRRNHVDKVEDSERGVIRKIEGGGNRLFVCRENVEGIEVWETSNFSGVRKIS